MIQRTRMFRVNGDSLSCWFSPVGALSSALLLADGAQIDVTSQLPGLTASNATCYLRELGYSSEHRADCIRVGKTVNERLQDSGLFVETVKVEPAYVVLSVVLREDRSYACCRRSFVALYRRSDRSLSFTAIRDPSLVEEFRVRLLQRDVQYNV